MHEPGLYLWTDAWSDACQGSLKMPGAYFELRLLPISKRLLQVMHFRSRQLVQYNSQADAAGMKLSAPHMPQHQQCAGRAQAQTVVHRQPPATLLQAKATTWIFPCCRCAAVVDRHSRQGVAPNKLPGSACWSPTLRAQTAASRSSCCRSAPEKPAVRASKASEARCTSPERGIFLARAVRMAARPSGEGRETYSTLSSLPGLQTDTPQAQQAWMQLLTGRQTMTVASCVSLASRQRAQRLGRP